MPLTKLFSSGQLDDLEKQVGGLEVTTRYVAQKSHLKLDELGKQVSSATNVNEFEKILTWISPFSFLAKHASVLGSVQPGTGKWLLENSVFRRWVDGQVNILWCPGIRKSPHSRW